MFESTYSLLCIFDKVNEVYGRKKLQKMIHLIESSGTSLPFRYEYHFYGPYSAALQEEINVLVQQGFLTEETDGEAYVYSITDKGRQFKDALETDGGYKLDLNLELIKSMEMQSSQFLEMVSTYAFLIESGYDQQHARSKALELKPHLGKYMDQAITYFNTAVCN